MVLISGLRLFCWYVVLWFVCILWVLGLWYLYSGAGCCVGLYCCILVAVVFACV